MPEVLHCRVKGCKATFKVKNFQDGMQKIRHHRKQAHPVKWKESVAKGIKTRKAKKSK